MITLNLKIQGGQYDGEELGFRSEDINNRIFAELLLEIENGGTPELNNEQGNYVFVSYHQPSNTMTIREL